MIFVISDLHLSLSNDKPMNVFGEHWNEHHIKIKEDWIRKVKEDDLVLLCGDISWSMRLEDALIDFKWIDELPGKKIISKGNHDYWWNLKGKLARRFDSIKFVSSNCLTYGRYAISGTRGWDRPLDKEGFDHDWKIYRREILRLENSLKASPDTHYKILMLHYPPIQGGDEPFASLAEEYGVQKVFYGHIHDKASYDRVFQGNRNGIYYALTSCDYLNFKLEVAALGSGENLGTEKSQFKSAAFILEKRLENIHLLEQGLMKKPEFIEKNSELLGFILDEFEGSSDELLDSDYSCMADAIIKYFYVNTMAKKIMLDADLEEFRNFERFIELRNSAYELYEYKERLTESIVNKMIVDGEIHKIEAYYVKSGSEFLKGRLIEVVFIREEKFLVHTISERVARVLKKEGILSDEIRLSVLDKYINQRNNW